MLKAADKDNIKVHGIQKKEERTISRHLNKESATFNLISRSKCVCMRKILCTHNLIIKVVNQMSSLIQRQHSSFIPQATTGNNNP